MFQKLIKFNGKNNVLCLYPNVTQKGIQYETKKFGINEITNIKEKIKKSYKDIKIINAKQTESYYKDLAKVSIESIKNRTYFVKKENNHVMFDNNLLVISNIVLLDELQYPNLSQYDYSCTKNMEIYKIGNIEILFVSLSDQMTVYLDISSMKENDEPLFNDIIAIYNS